jgi:hypothetical protein
MGWFLRSIAGLIARPYETVRSTVDRGNIFELIFIAMPLMFYFALASLVKVARFRPFLLTREFVILSGATLITYMFAVMLFWTIGKLVGAQGKFKGFAVAWGYSLVPTFGWFLATSILYVLLPPPRTTSLQGILFSLLFLIFSATLFFWKVTIGYLALRFGLRLDLGKILIVLAVTLPILGLYSFGMYRLGIFKIPFI